MPAHQQYLQPGNLMQQQIIMQAHQGQMPQNFIQAGVPMQGQMPPMIFNIGGRTFIQGG